MVVAPQTTALALVPPVVSPRDTQRNPISAQTGGGILSCPDAMNLSERSIVFVLGAPGAGKGTLCKLLSADLELKHISIGDLLRQVVSSPGADNSVVECVRRGELVSTEQLFSILKPHIESESRPIILLDGFPRRFDQAERFEETFGHPALVLFFDCPKRLVENNIWAAGNAKQPTW